MPKHYFGEVAQALEHIYLLPEEKEHPTAKPLRSVQGKIHFDQVTFGFPNTTPLFKNLSVKILPKQKVGIVGISGSGKSTFVKLLLGLYTPKQGTISLDDQDIAIITKDSLRQSIGVILQHTPLLHRSIRENIAYGKSDLPQTTIEKAAKRAYIHDFITNTPDQYDTIVGEQGMTMSGGQRQRLSIARIIVQNPAILVLDEATAQQDTTTTQSLQEAFQELTQDKTTLIITHKLSTLLRMDRILVFHQGAIVEDGTHQALMAKGGHYKALRESETGRQATPKTS